MLFALLTVDNDGAHQVVLPDECNSSLNVWAVFFFSKIHTGTLQPMKHKVHKLQANEADVPAVLCELTAGRCSSRLSAHHSFIHLHLYLHLHSEQYSQGCQKLYLPLCLIIQHQDVVGKFRILSFISFRVIALNFYVASFTYRKF